jgi:hypothetical protein
MIAGLFPYTRGGVTHPPTITLQEIPQSLAINPSYRRDLLVLAGDERSAEQLESFGLNVHRVFEDAPAEIHHDTAHKMKHWMCLWALETFGEFLWVDWDTVLLRQPDDDFWAFCRRGGAPKFIHIPNYWATVNCGVYYAGKDWLAAMKTSFAAEVSEPNDELLWTSVLPADVLMRAEFWWGERVAHVWTRDDFEGVGPGTYFAHVKHLDWADDLRRRR